VSAADAHDAPHARSCPCAVRGTQTSRAVRAWWRVWIADAGSLVGAPANACVSGEHWPPSLASMSEGECTGETSVTCQQWDRDPQHTDAELSHERQKGHQVGSYYVALTSPRLISSLR
jgi:hypothetical protein